MAQSVAESVGRGQAGARDLSWRRPARGATAFPRAPAPWIDLSTGIDPVPYPIGSLAGRLGAAAGAAAIAALEAAAASAYGWPRSIRPSPRRARRR